MLWSNNLRYLNKTLLICWAESDLCPCSARSCTCCAISLTSDIIYRIENAPHSLVLRGPNLPDAEIASHPSPPHPPAAVSCCCLILFVFAVVIAFDTPVFSAERFASFRFQRLTDVTNAVIVFGFWNTHTLPPTWRSPSSTVSLHILYVSCRDGSAFSKTFIFNRAKSARWEN